MASELVTRQIPKPGAWELPSALSRLKEQGSVFPGAEVWRKELRVKGT